MLEQALQTMSDKTGIAVDDLLVIAGKGTFYDWNIANVSVCCVANDFTIQYKTQDFTVVRTICAGARNVYCGVFSINPLLHGLGNGTCYTRKLVALCNKYGFKMRASCARGDDYNGYYTWARMGYEGKVHVGNFYDVDCIPCKGQNVKQAALSGLDKMLSRGFERHDEVLRWRLFVEEHCDARGWVRVQAIIRHFGLEWWKVNGVDFKGTLDCRTGSRALQRFAAYCQERDNV
jgi:hypothetical protein